MLAIEIPEVPERPTPNIDQETRETLRALIRDTTVSRHAAEEEQAHNGLDGLFRLFAARVIDNLDAWLVSGDWPDRPRTAAELVTELVESGEFDLASPADARLLRHALDEE